LCSDKIQTKTLFGSVDSHGNKIIRNASLAEAETTGAARVTSETTQGVSPGDEGATERTLPSGAGALPHQQPRKGGGGR